MLGGVLIGYGDFLAGPNVLLGEPVGSTVLAYFFLHEPITLVKALGGILILVGIYLSSRR